MLLQNTNSNSGVLNNASQITDVVWDSIYNIATGIVARLPLIIAGLIIAALFFLFARFVKTIFLATSTRAKLDERLRLLFSTLIVVGIVLLGIFTALTVVVPTFGFGDLIAGIGLTTFIIGFATKDILNNLLSGVLILWQQPFRVGDHLYVDTVQNQETIQGRVEYIGVRATSLRKDDGELVLIPNGDMYSGVLTIRGAGSKRRMNLELKIGYEADVDAAKATILSALLETEGVATTPSPNVFVTDLASEGVNITVFYWINTNESRRRVVFDRAATAIMKALSESGVEPYPPGSVIVLNSNGEESSNGHSGARSILEA
ncbi:MAG: mechanosensitive ion channel family protein [Pyrinomonadaceae bacterium]